jgi:hypothetical protein
LTVTVGNAKVGVAVRVGVNVIVGVSVIVGVRVSVGARVSVCVAVGASVGDSTVAVAADVGLLCSSVAGAQADTKRKIIKMIL